MKKTVIILVCVGIIGLLAIVLVPKCVEVENAVVNPNNGDIAFLYVCFSDKIDFIKLDLYNKEGEKQFSKTFSLYEISYGGISFYNDVLCVKTVSTVYFFDRSGESVNEKIDLAEIKNKTTFEKWSYSFLKSKYTIEFGDYKYSYQRPTIFKRQAVLKITKDTESVVIYKSTE
jgi:hypothetical protein